MNHVGNQRQSGFTLIELMLAMTFIAILLLAIAMTVIQIGSIYNKGLSMKELSQSSRVIADDLDRTAAQAKSLNLTTDYATETGGGRLCFGSYSYIWNYGQATDPEAPIADASVTTYEGDEARTIQLVKVPDGAKIYCARDTNDLLLYTQIRAVDVPQAQELLPQGDHSMRVYQFSVPDTLTTTDPSTGKSLFTTIFTIGSGNLTAMNSDYTACLGPDDPNSDLVYCNVQQFTIVLRVGSGE